jgi:hypothetical protein
MGRAGRALGVPAALVLLASAAGAQGAKPLSKCAPDAVASGSVCIDRYEASVWRVTDPAVEGAALVKKIQQGKVRLDELLLAARQLGTLDDYAPCADGGQNCDDGSNNNIFAVSLAGILPSAHITWFQAQQACKNSRKRLPTSTEWQAAVAGTDDPGSDNFTTTCNTASTQTAVPTGSREACVSSDGAFDMVGNLSEWVADSVPLSDPAAVAPCGAWSTGDEQCLNGERLTTGAPGVLIRGGSFTSGSAAGPLAITDAGPTVPTTSSTTTSTTTTTTVPSTTTTTTTVPATTTTSTTSTSTTSTTSTSTTTTTLPPFFNVGFRCVR